jgi:hypothetical protein
MEESESDRSSNDNSRSFAAVGQPKLAIQAVMELVSVHSCGVFGGADQPQWGLITMQRLT